jgi:hypothetical protein
VDVNAEIWVHTCWGNPNQQRVHWKVPSYERALPDLLRLNCDVLTLECASSGQFAETLGLISDETNLLDAARARRRQWFLSAATAN